MTTYTWLGGVSAPWTSASFWSVNGTPTGGVPGGADTALVAAAGTYTITAGTVGITAITISDPNATLQVNTQFATGALVNAGTINVAAGGTLSGQGPTFDNTGTIALATGAQLFLTGNVTTFAIGAVVNTGGTVTLSSVNNTGGTLSSLALGNVIIQSVTSGIIRNDGGTLVFGNGTLSGVTVQGIFNPGNDFIAGGLTLQTLEGGQPGTIDIGGNNSGYLWFQDSETLDNVILNVAGLDKFSFGFRLQFPTLTLGSNSVMHATANTLPGLTDLWGVQITGNALIAEGSIDNTGSLVISAESFLNSGTVVDLGGTILATGTAVANNGTFTDLGGIVNVTGATLYNAGIITANAGTVTLASSFVGGGAGTLAIAGGGTLALGGGYALQQFSFADSNDYLSLAFVGGTAAMQGFAPGDTIELVGTPATVAFSAGTLSIVSGPFTLGSFLMGGVPANAQFHSITDASSNTFITETIACFAAGTRIATARGEVAVEHLRVGDLLPCPHSGRVRPVRWIGRRHIVCASHPRPADVHPIRVRAGAFAAGVPHRDLYLSPDHSVFAGGALVPARRLVNFTTVAPVPCDEVTYWHVQLDRHDLILSEGLATESYLDIGAVAVASAICREANACAALSVAGPILHQTRSILRARAAAATA